MRIRLEGVRKSFASHPVLNGIDLEVDSGRVLAVLGASGAGKSVLLRLVNGLVRPDEGRVFVGPDDVASLTEPELARLRLDVGYVFQYSALFDSLSVFENIVWAAREHRGLRGEALKLEAGRCLERVGLEDLVPRMERTAPATLSGGRRKRVGLARALALEPSVLLYDEPTSGLDPASTRGIGSLIRQLNRNSHITSVVVTHDVELALEVGHSVAILAEGHLAYEGTPAELREARRDGAVRKYLEGE